MSYYRIKEQNGSHVILTPSGEPTFLTGVNHVGDGSIHPFDLETNSENLRTWRQSIVDDMKTWGFNHLAPAHTALATQRHHPKPGEARPPMTKINDWSIEDLVEADYPFFHMLGLPVIDEDNPRYPDVFSDAFHQAVDLRCQEDCTRLKENTNLIGYFYSHNMPFNSAHLGIDEGFDNWIVTITQPGCVGRQRWIQLMKRLYGTVENYGRIYYPVKTWEEIDGVPDILRGIVGCQYVREDMIAFIREVAREYYKVMYEAVKRYDPNHLIFGDRQTIHRQVMPTYVLDCLEPYLDVLTVNMMGPADQMILRNLHDILIHWRKPILLGDVGARIYNGLVKSGFLVDSQDAQNQFYEEHIRMGVSHPQLLGLVWCGYWETSGHFSGIRDCTTNEVNQSLVETMTQWNQWAHETTLETWR